MLKKILSIVLCFVLIYFSVNAQTEIVTFPFSFHVFDQDNKTDIAEKALSVYENGNFVKTIYTNETGVVKYNFKINNDYKIVVQGSDNYIEKTIQIDTRNIALNDWRYKNSKQVSIGYEIQIQLFKTSSLTCQNFAFLKDSPVMHLKYDDKHKDIIDVVGDKVMNQIKKERRKTCQRKVVTQKLRVVF